MPASNSVRQNQAYLDSLHARLREKNERVVSLMRRKLGSSDAIMPAIREITETAATTLAVERTSLWLFNSDRSHLRCIDLYLRSTNEHSSGELLAADDLKAYLQSIESERIVVADNCLAIRRTHEFADSYSRRHGISSMLDAGVWIDGAFSGILCHEHVGPPRKWEIDEILFVSSLADVAALSFEICELRHSEEQLAQRVDFKELLARLSTRSHKLSSTKS